MVRELGSAGPGLCTLAGQSESRYIAMRSLLQQSWLPAIWRGRELGGLRGGRAPGLHSSRGS